MTSAIFVVLCLIADCALAQQNSGAKHDDLDVTMQIIVDPDAKLPDEVIRRIPLPRRKPDDRAEQADRNNSAKPDAAAAGQQRAREAAQLGREMSETAREKAQEAAEQREQARRSMAEDRRRNPGPPVDPPGPPPVPPHP